MTTQQTTHFPAMACPAEDLLKLLVGKWKPQILMLASREPLRFNSLLKKLVGSNKQSLSVALRELEEAEMLTKTVIAQKPLHIEYTLTERGRSMISIFRLAGSFAHKHKVETQA